MASFFQPTGTVGAYDPTERRLTVLCGSTATLGFRALSQKEEDDVVVSASESDALGARYRMGALRTEFEMDTSRPRRYTVTAQKDSPMMPMGDVTPPLEIKVYYLAKKLSQMAAIGQDKDPTACWAACLAWWATALSGNGRPSATLNDMLMRFSGMWSSDGSINVKAFHAAMRDKGSDFRMKTRDIVPTTLANYLGFWPVVVGFRAPGGFGHMNVLYDYNPTTRRVKAMEPWFPDTDNLTQQDDGTMYLNDPSFRFVGQQIERDVSYYHRAAPGGGTVLVGYPEEFNPARLN